MSSKNCDLLKNAEKVLAENDKLTNLPHLQSKTLRKKRVHSSSFSASTEYNALEDGVIDAASLSALMGKLEVTHSRLPFTKNSRKSRDGRKIPNKRGGKKLPNPNEILDEIDLDQEDPDYDSDLHDPIVFETVKPRPTDVDFERIFPGLLREFYTHGSTTEVLTSLKEMNPAPHQLRTMTYWAITSALQQKKTQCELTSELLSDLCGPILTQAYIQQGIQMVLYELGDLVIDVPNAVEQVGRFIARALADDILPPKFIDYQKSVLTSMQSPDEPASSATPPASAPPSGASVPIPLKQANGRNLSGGDQPRVGSVDTHASSGFVSESSLASVNSQLALSALKRAETLLSLSRAFARLDNIWGIPAGPRATSALVVKVQSLLSQYFESGDVEEARTSLVDLDCPHFHHEMVYQCIVKYIETSTDQAFELAVQLLSQLCHSAEVTSDQMVLGVRRVHAELPDLKLDVPKAYQLMDKFVRTATNGHFLAKRVAADLNLNRSRKRIVSETAASYMSDLASGFY